MTQRRGLGRGLGALIPTGGVPAPAPAAPVTAEPDPSAAPPPVVTVEDVVDLRDGVSPSRYEQVSVSRPAAQADAPPPASDAPTAPQLVYREIPVDQIAANAWQPRQVFDDEAIDELVTSITTVGLLQPVVVRPAPDGYELVAGERRLRATRKAGLASIPALVRHTDDDAMLRDALLENLHRVQLNPLEEAAAYSQLMSDFACTQEELAGRVGRSRPQVANTLRLLKLPPMVQRRVAAGVLSAGHARAILSVGDADRMERLATKVVTEGLSVRAVEELVLLDEDSGKPARKRRTNSSRVPVEYQEAAERVAEMLETRVRVEGTSKGRLIIEFADVTDLARIIEAIASSPTTASHPVP